MEKEGITPNDVPPKMIANGTIRSYPAAKKSGTNTGKKNDGFFCHTIGRG
jgi:hypothetical protein